MSSIPCNTGRRRDEIDYELSKKNFIKLAENKMGNHEKRRQLFLQHTKGRIEQIIAQKLAHPPLHSNYEVITKEGKNILMMKKKTTHSYIQILSWEEIFDLLMPLHVRTGHRGKEILQKELLTYCSNRRIEYKYPIISLYLFRRACNLCVQNNGRFSLLKASKIGVVHVIAMAQTRLEERFRYLLIYADKETHYITLRPLTEKSNLEISAELYKIFTQFGPPMRLFIHGYNATLTEKIGSSLNEICPEFRIETEHQPARYELPAVVTERIQEWMTKSKSSVWELGCSIVQAEMNNDPQMRPSSKRNQPRCTPHTLYFHTKPDHIRDLTLSTPKTFNTKTFNTNTVIDVTDQNLESKATETTDRSETTGHNNKTERKRRTKQNEATKQKQMKQTQAVNQNQATNQANSNPDTNFSQENSQNQTINPSRGTNINQARETSYNQVSCHNQTTHQNQSTDQQQVRDPSLVTNKNQARKTRSNQVSSYNQTSNQNQSTDQQQVRDPSLGTNTNQAKETSYNQTSNQNQSTDQQQVRDPSLVTNKNQARKTSYNQVSSFNQTYNRNQSTDEQQVRDPSLGTNTNQAKETSYNQTSNQNQSTDQQQVRDPSLGTNTNQARETSYNQVSSHNQTTNQNQSTKQKQLSNPNQVTYQSQTTNCNQTTKQIQAADQSQIETIDLLESDDDVQEVDVSDADGHSSDSESLRIYYSTYGMKLG